MRRVLTACTAALLLVGGSGVAAPTASAGPLLPVSPMVPDVPGTTVQSPNVTHIGTIPLEGVGVSMRVVKVGDQVRAFVSGAGGLSIYDATNPENPLLLGHLPIYNWENEDIAVSKDGKTAILTEFEGTFYLHVIDVSNPALPQLAGSMLLHGAHTVECADTACGYLFGSEGQTYDIRDRAHPTELPAASSWGVLTGAGSGHNLHQDAAGLWTSDTMPLVVFKQDPDPLHLTVLTKGAITLKTAYQHNNIRPRADAYRPREQGASPGGPLRPGELLLGEGETNFSPQCGNGSGAFSTWSMVGLDQGRPLTQLHVLRPVNGAALSKDPAVAALGCSGHWFTEKDADDGSILVAAGWYEHGTRFLGVDPGTGEISQLGYFQAQRGSTSQAYWIPGTDVVWSVDYHSGIDILRFDQSAAKRPTAAAIEANWLVNLHAVDAFSVAMRELCRAGVQATPAQHAQAHVDYLGG